jgi:hypothetical protein
MSILLKKKYIPGKKILQNNIVVNKYSSNLTNGLIIKSRKVFFFENNINNETKAGGVIFYKKNKNSLQNDAIKFLFIESFDDKGNKRVEDFGGKTDLTDENINQTISREVVEESNNIFYYDNIYQRVITSNKKIFIKKCKYLVVFCELVETDKIFLNNDTDIFGDVETFTGMKRKIKWFPISLFKNKDFCNNTLHIRLQNNDIYEYIKKMTV